MSFDCSFKRFLRSFWISKTTAIMSSSALEYRPYANINLDCFSDTLVRYSFERKSRRDEVFKLHFEYGYSTDPQKWVEVYREQTP